MAKSARPQLKSVLVNSNRVLEPDVPSVPPVARQNRVEVLIEILAVLEERFPEQALLHGAEFPERAVAAAVLHGRPRFKPLHAERVERELDHQGRTVLEHTGAPERRSDREAPLRELHPRPVSADLENPDRSV